MPFHFHLFGVYYLNFELTSSKHLITFQGAGIFSLHTVAAEAQT